MSHCSGSGDITPSALRTAAYYRLKHMQPFYFSLLLSSTCVHRRCFVNSGRIERICFSLPLSLFSLSSGIFPPTLALFCADLTLYILTCLKCLQDLWQLIIKLEAIYQEYTAVKQGLPIILPLFGLKSSSMPGSTGWFPESSDLCASLAAEACCATALHAD